jgi:shikimate 5-dehydrogenase
MTGMLGHPVAENPIDRMFDAVYAHYGLLWQFWKNDIANTDDLATARQRGCPVVDGVEMLVQLAMQIFEQWTGVTPEEGVFQRAVAEALGET